MNDPEFPVDDADPLTEPIPRPDQGDYPFPNPANPDTMVPEGDAGVDTNA